MIVVLVLQRLAKRNVTIGLVGRLFVEGAVHIVVVQHQTLIESLAKGRVGTLSYF